MDKHVTTRYRPMGEVRLCKRKDYLSPSKKTLPITFVSRKSEFYDWLNFVGPSLGKDYLWF